MKLLNWLLLGMLIACQTSQAATVYVSVNGNDRNAGTSATAPLATVKGAVAKIQQLGGGTINFLAGTYYIDAPINLSGSTSIVFQPYNNANVIISGARLVTGKLSKKGNINILTPDDPSLLRKGELQLFAGEQRLKQAESPNDDNYFYIKNVMEDASGKKTVNLDTAANNLGSILKSTDGATVKVYTKWNFTQYPITSAAGKSFTSTGMAISKFTPWNSGTRVKIVNTLAALDDDGEFYTDGKTISFIASGTQIYAPTTDVLFNITGSGISFKNLHFKYSGCVLPDKGFDPQQAAAAYQAAIQADNASNLTFDGCSFEHFGYNVMWFRNNVHHVIVSNCLFSDMGMGAVKSGNYTAVSDPSQLTSDIKITNNIIKTGGRLNPAAPGITSFNISDLTISNNDISDMFYSGISTGWTWGFKTTLNKNITISNNVIHEIGQGVMDDLGGIYTLGLNANSSITHNVVYDILCYRYGGWGIYLDQGSSDFTIQNNIVYNTNSGGFFLSQGRDNKVHNNIFANGRSYQMKIGAFDGKSVNNTITKNIIVGDGSSNWLDGYWSKMAINLDSNVYCSNAQNVQKIFANGDLNYWRKLSNKDKNSVVVANTKVEDEDVKSQSFVNNSLKQQIGFKNIDVQNAGVTAENSYKNTANIKRTSEVYWKSLNKHKFDPNQNGN